jgi:hypothetical protein
MFATDPTAQVFCLREQVIHTDALGRVRATFFFARTDFSGTFRGKDLAFHVATFCAEWIDATGLDVHGALLSVSAIAYL